MHRADSPPEDLQYQFVHDHYPSNTCQSGEDGAGGAVRWEAELPEDKVLMETQVLEMSLVGNIMDYYPASAEIDVAG